MAPSHSEQQPQLSNHPSPTSSPLPYPSRHHQSRAPKLCQAPRPPRSAGGCQHRHCQTQSAPHYNIQLLPSCTERRFPRDHGQKNLQDPPASPAALHVWPPGDGPVGMGWAGDWSTPPPASSPARMPRCWHSPQPGRLADYKGECVISNTQSDFPALLPITKCLVKWLILFSHRNVFPFKSLIRGEEGKKKEKAKLKISSERYHDSNRFTGK